MRFFVMSNEFKVVEIVLVESCIGEILLAEFLQRFLVEDVLKMFQLRRSASLTHGLLLARFTYGECKLEHHQV